MGRDLKGKELGKNLSQRKDGRYEAKYTDNFGKRHSIYGEKLNEVRKALNEALYEKEHGLYFGNTNWTLNEWFDIWVENYYVKKSKPTTYAESVYKYNLCVRNSFLGKMRLKNINNVHVQNFINEMIEEKPHLTGRSVQRYLTPLRLALSQAAACGYIPNNPASELIVPKSEPKEKLALSKEEQDLFLKYAQKYKYYPIYQILFLTGMRGGEILALTWDDIDFESKLIKISKTITSITGQKIKACQKVGITVDNCFLVTSPKTKSGKRNIPISDDCLLVLMELYKKRTYETDLIFHTKKNNPLSIPTLYINMKLIVTKINEQTGMMMPPISLHNLRHTFATRCFEEGIDAKTVQFLLGHTNISTTMDVYTHVNRNIALQAINKITL